MKLTSLLFLFIISNSITAQTLDWAKSVGGSSQDAGFAIISDPAGNIYTTGYFIGTVDFDPNAGEMFLSSLGSGDIFIQKLDAEGNFIWAKSMGGSAFDSGYAIALDEDGNIYTTGGFSETVDFDPSDGVFNLDAVGGADIFVQKLNSDGDFIWAKAMGGTGTEDGHGIIIDADANILLTGDFMNMVDFDPNDGVLFLSSAGGEEAFVAKYDTDGNLIWANSFGNSTTDEGNGIAVDADGNSYTAGGFSGTVDFDPSPASFELSSVSGALDAFVLKLNADGEFVWAKGYGSSGGDHSIAIAISEFNYIIVSGGFRNSVDFDPNAGEHILESNGGTDVFVQKLDLDGDFINATHFGGSTNDLMAYSMAVDAEEKITVFWSTDNDGALASFANISLDEVGETIHWTMTIPDVRYCYAIAPTSFSNIVATGAFTGTVDFDPFPYETILTSSGGIDVYILKIHPSDLGLTAIYNPSIINLYPNPSNGFIKIDLPLDTKLATVKVLDYTGKLVHESTVNKLNAELNLSQLVAGIYQLKIQLDTGEIISQKLIIQH